MRIQLGWMVPVALVLGGLVSCSKEEIPLEASTPEAAVADAERQGSAHGAQLLSKFDPEALQYVNCVKTIMYATDAFTRPSYVPAADEDYPNMEALQQQNPMSLKLAGLDIVDERTGKNISFFDLPLEHRRRFAEQLLLEEAEHLSAQLREVPYLREAIAQQNRVAEKSIAQKRLTPLQVVVEGEPQLAPASLGVKRVESQPFFLEIRREMYPQQQESAQDASQEQPQSWEDVYIHLNPKRVRGAWSLYARRGDFLLALPVHYAPWAFINVFYPTRFYVGHAAILTRYISGSTDIRNDECTLECFPKGGVQPKAIKDWDACHYVMGVRRVTRRWQWWPPRYRTVYSPVSNPSALAYWAEKYRGRGYVTKKEFLTAKWAAPARFTCTTLVWWCAKKAYGVNVSAWYAPLVTPDGLFTDDCTYVRKNVDLRY